MVIDIEGAYSAYSLSLKSTKRRYYDKINSPIWMGAKLAKVDLVKGSLLPIYDPGSSKIWMADCMAVATAIRKARADHKVIPNKTIQGWVKPKVGDKVIIL